MQLALCGWIGDISERKEESMRCRARGKCMLPTLNLIDMFVFRIHFRRQKSGLSRVYKIFQAIFITPNEKQLPFQTVIASLLIVRLPVECVSKWSEQNRTRVKWNPHCNCWPRAFLKLNNNSESHETRFKKVETAQTQTRREFSLVTHVEAVQGRFSPS